MAVYEAYGSAHGVSCVELGFESISFFFAVYGLEREVLLRCDIFGPAFDCGAADAGGVLGSGLGALLGVLLLTPEEEEYQGGDYREECHGADDNAGDSTCFEALFVDVGRGACHRLDLDVIAGIGI